MTNKTGVYQIKINNKLYIGSTTYGFKARWSSHLNSLKKGKHASRYLQRAFDKHGENDTEFSILEVVENKEDCLSREQYYIDLFGFKTLYNLSPTARNSFGVKHTAETKANMSKAAMGKNPSIETRRKMSLALKQRVTKESTRQKRSKRMLGNQCGKGKPCSEETKKKISTSEKGKYVSNETREKLRRANIGKKLSEETKRKIGMANKGKKLSDETKSKISETKRNKGRMYNKSIVNTIFNCEESVK